MRCVRDGDANADPEHVRIQTDHLRLLEGQWDLVVNHRYDDAQLSRITVELKSAAAQEPLFAAIHRFGARDRVIAAGMYDRDRTLFHVQPGEVAEVSIEYPTQRNKSFRLTRQGMLTLITGVLEALR